MSMFEKHEGQTLVLSKSVGALSAGTPVEIVSVHGDRADVRTLRPMPDVSGFEMDNERPLLTDLPKQWLVWRRARAKNITLGSEGKK